MASTRWQYWLRFNLPHVIYLLVLIAIAGTSYWWVRQDKNTQNKTVEKSSERMDGYAKNAELTQISDNGKLLYQANMSDIEHFANQNINGQNVVLISTADGQPKVVVNAQKATWRSTEKMVELTGQVVLQREATGDNPAMKLSTEKMKVDMSQGMASSDENFVMNGGTNVMTGKRFRYDYQLRDLEMGVAKTDTQQGARIKAQIVGTPRS